MTKKTIVLTLDQDAALTLGAMVSIAQAVLTCPAAPEFFAQHMDDASAALIAYAVGVLSTKMDNSPPSVQLMYERVAGMEGLVKSVLARALEGAA